MRADQYRRFRGFALLRLCSRGEDELQAQHEAGKAQLFTRHCQLLARKLYTQSAHPNYLGPIDAAY